MSLSELSERQNKINNNNLRTSHRRCSIKQPFLKAKKYLQENTCVVPFFCKVSGLSCKIFKNTYFDEHLRSATSVISLLYKKYLHDHCSKTSKEKKWLRQHKKWTSLVKITAQIMKFSIKDFFSKCDREIRNWKLYFLCSGFIW